MIHQDWVLILDFGSQYNQLIARRVRELSVYSQISPFSIPLQTIKNNPPKGIIFSGGPRSVYEEDAPCPDPGIYALGIPILGICYGAQVMMQQLGGQVAHSKEREYGRTPLTVVDDADLFAGIPKKFVSWMSHGDLAKKLPAGFEVLARTENTPYAALGNREKGLFGVQFHPEVAHTENGIEIIKNFLFTICRCSATWTMETFIENSVRQIAEEVGTGNVVLGLSGGVDSSVAAALLSKALGPQLHAIFVDNGLLRQGEREKITLVFQEQFDVDVHIVDARRRFLSALCGVIDPEKKRKIIGHEFIRVFEEEAKKIGNATHLAQGTLYPDVIESVSAFGGPSATIKSHHNVGGLPEKMRLKLLEPLRELFKDEVRQIGLRLGLSEDIVWRHPFPGPGLAVRIVGEISEEKCTILRNADAIILEEIKKAGFYKDIWQAFGVLLPVKSVGVMGDERTYEYALILRAVTSLDGMTADWVRLPYELLGCISSRIINEVRGINRVAYDVSSKPPATIEWE